MANDNEKLVRAAIGGLIRGVQPNAIVYPWNALSHDLTSWPGQFRRNDGTVHGWIVKLANEMSERKNAYRDKRNPVFDVWGLYGFRVGKEGDNSDDEFSVINDTVYEGIKAEPRLGFDAVVEYHGLLQLVDLSTLDCGEETLHIARHRLPVHLCC